MSRSPTAAQGRTSPACAGTSLAGGTVNVDISHFARVRGDIADVRFPGKRIVLVTDSPKTHKLSTLYETFEPAEASRLAERFEVHHAPKHGSWLNLAEIEINVLSRQCLDRRIPDRETMRSEVAAWGERRNETSAPVNWRFRTADARVTLKSLYPSIQ